jgi:hypothetical protein
LAVSGQPGEVRSKLASAAAARAAVVRCAIADGADGAGGADGTDGADGVDGKRSLYSALHETYIKSDSVHQTKTTQRRQQPTAQRSSSDKGNRTRVDISATAQQIS